MLLTPCGSGFQPGATTSEATTTARKRFKAETSSLKSVRAGSGGPSTRPSRPMRSWMQRGTPAERINSCRPSLMLKPARSSPCSLAIRTTASNPAPAALRTDSGFASGSSSTPARRSSARTMAKARRPGDPWPSSSPRSVGRRSATCACTELKADRSPTCPKSHRRKRCGAGSPTSAWERQASRTRE